MSAKQQSVHPSDFTKEAVLYNGKKVKEGDKVFYINSDGERLEGVIERRSQDYDLAKPAGHEPRFQQQHKNKVLKKGTLFFWNPQFLITDYFTADVSLLAKTRL